MGLYCPCLGHSHSNHIQEKAQHPPLYDHIPKDPRHDQIPNFPCYALTRARVLSSLDRTLLLYDSIDGLEKFILNPTNTNSTLSWIKTCHLIHPWLTAGILGGCPTKRPTKSNPYNKLRHMANLEHAQDSLFRHHAIRSPGNSRSLLDWIPSKADHSNHYTEKKYPPPYSIWRYGLRLEEGNSVHKQNDRPTYNIQWGHSWWRSYLILGKDSEVANIRKTESFTTGAYLFTRPVSLVGSGHVTSSSFMLPSTLVALHHWQWPLWGSQAPQDLPKEIQQPLALWFVLVSIDDTIYSTYDITKEFFQRFIYLPMRMLRTGV